MKGYKAGNLRAQVTKQKGNNSKRHHKVESNESVYNKMTNTKHHDRMAAPVSSESQNQHHQHQQQQQQGLLRLLAQHFNSQFYQIANQQQQQLDNRQQQQQLQANNNNNSSGAINFQSPLALPQSYQQHQIRASQEAINFATTPANRPFLPDLMLPIGAGSTGLIDQANLMNQLARSQQHQQSGLSALANSQNIHKNQTVSANALQTLTPPVQMTPSDGLLTCSPLFTTSTANTGNNNNNNNNPINLFNALNCFNMTNDQFLLSLQQQYLLQAASTMHSRHPPAPTATSNHNNTINYASNNTINHVNNLESSPLQQQQQQQQQALHIEQVQSNLAQKQTSANSSSRRLLAAVVGGATDLSNGGDVSLDGGRKLLKFSINTILGRRSPCRTSVDKIKSNCGVGMPSSSSINQYLIGQQDRLNTSSEVTGEGNNQQCADSLPDNHQASSPECDPDFITDIDSDSSLADDSPQPDERASAFSQRNKVNRDSPFDESQRVGLMNLSAHNHHQSASSSTNNNQRPSPNDDQLNVTGIKQHPGGPHHTPLSFLGGPTVFPWTAAARGKPRRGMMRRAVFSDSQRVGLEKRFQLQKYISKPDRKKLAEKLGLRDSQVKIWFQNRRMKWRNSKERELLSAGGSREQTLPTRNNPNPDLSDVGETIKRLGTSTNSLSNPQD